MDGDEIAFRVGFYVTIAFHCHDGNEMDGQEEDWIIHF